MSVGIFRTYTNNLKNHWFSYLSGMIALLVTCASEVMTPKFIQWSIDLLTHHETAKIPYWLKKASIAESLNTIMVTFLASLTLGWLGRIGWRHLLAKRSHCAGHQIKTQLWEVLKDQPLSFLERFPLGDLMNRATGDWNKSRFIHGFTMVLTFDIIFFSILALISMFMIDFELALLSLFLIPFLPRSIIRLSKQEYYQHQKAQEKLSRLSDTISQAVNTARLQRATASEGTWEKRLSEQAASYAADQLQVLKIGWKIFILGALPTIGAYAVLFSFGVYKIQNGAISIGEFIALQSYVLLLQSPLFELGSVISEWQTGFASFGRIIEIFGQKVNLDQSDRKTSKQINLASDAIVVKGLHFSYPSMPEPTLQKVAFRIRRGEKIGITGPIGAGKTTLVHLIAGLVDGYQGEIQLFGEPLNRFGRDWLTKNLTMIPQKPFLFAGTIRSNLELDRSMSDEEIKDVLQVVQLWDDIQRMPEGIDTWIGEWGINLSGGQKQRLAIARALLRPTAILILDDCLSAVDSVTEEHILQNLSVRFADQTLIWTAHRTSTLQLCDRIFRLKDGFLKEEMLGQPMPVSRVLTSPVEIPLR